MITITCGDDHLLELILVGFDTDRRKDLLNIGGARAGIPAESGKQVGGDVTHLKDKNIIIYLNSVHLQQFLRLAKLQAVTANHVARPHYGIR